MPVSDFLPFAIATGANVETQNEFASDPALGPGYASGQVQSHRVNKLWRQSSFVSAAVARMMMLQLDQDVLDNGNLNDFTLKLSQAIANLGGIGAGGGIPEAPIDGETYGRGSLAWIAVVPLSGATMTGPLILAADPISDLEAVTKQYVDTGLGLKAPIDSPTFTGVPFSTNAPLGTTTRQIATCAFVDLTLATKAPLNSPVFLGVPTAPTALNGTNTTQLATCQFVANAITAGSVTSVTAGAGLTGGGTGAVTLSIAAAGVTNTMHANSPPLTLKGNYLGTAGAPVDMTATQAMTLLNAASLSGAVFTGKVTTVLSATGGSGFNLPHGVAPTSISNGDVWTTTTGMFARINGATVGPFGVGGGISALTGDVSASGTGSVVATLATVNSNIGTFQGLTVNGKGLITAAANQNYITAATGNTLYLPLGGGTLTGPLFISGSTSGALELRVPGTTQTSMIFHRQGAAVDQRKWEVISGTDGSFSIRTINDAYTGSHEAFKAYRGTGFSVANVDINSNLRVVGPYYFYINGVPFAYADVLNTGYNKLYDNTGAISLYLGGTPGYVYNLYRQNGHWFQDRAGAGMGYFGPGELYIYDQRGVAAGVGGVAYFQGKNAGGGLVSYAGIGGYATEGTPGAESGLCALKVVNGGVFQNAALIGAASNTFYAPIISTSIGNPAIGQFHMAPNSSGTGYGSMWYNDSSVTYLLLTNNNNAFGSFNGLRPFYINNASGLVTMGCGLKMNVGGITIFQGVDTGSTLTLYDDGNGHVESSVALWLNGNTQTSINVGGPLYGTSGSFSGRLYANGGLTVTGSDAMEVYSTVGAARTRYHFASQRIYSVGCTSDGYFQIGDENAGASRLHITPQGSMFIPVTDLHVVQYLHITHGTADPGKSSIRVDTVNVVLNCSNNGALYLNNDAADRSIYMRGNVYLIHSIMPSVNATGNVGVPGAAWGAMACYAYNGPSSRSEKTDIVNSPNGALEKVAALRTVDFRWRENISPQLDATRRHRGFIADEVADVFGPDWGGYSRIERAGKPYETIAYNELTAVLWQAVRELSSQVATLKDEIATLTA